ncbi:hypothetical protein [Actinoplanes sp. NPDC049681]|uniref:hypothetical protein n=1 Tax=Actinoplanes sp. NPDC049681 TaxID=3363905 RepID=UPI00379FA16F
MTMTAASGGRIAMTERIARWALDPDGDMYGDERERLRWYEGISTAAGIQWLAVPWAAAVGVWIYGRPVVAALTAVLLVMYVPCVLCTAYVRRRRVDTTPRSWSRKRILVTLLSVLPYLLFTFGAAHAMDSDGSATAGAGVGLVIGGGLAALWWVFQRSRRRRQEAAGLQDAD